MSSESYLIASGFSERTSLFLRSMAWGSSDNGGSPSTTLPEGSHQMSIIKEGSPTYNTFANLGTNSPQTSVSTRGYLATFLQPSATAGWEITESWKYDTTTGTAAAYELLEKLKEQEPNTLLLLSTKDDASTNSSIFVNELKEHWGATKTVELSAGQVSSYVLVAAKGKKKIYEEYADSGQGPVGFCGWLKNKAYPTGGWYVPNGISGLGYQADSFSDTFASNEYAEIQGLFKTNRAGEYKFSMASNYSALFWLGEEAVSGSQYSNTKIGMLAGGSGEHIEELLANTYYPLKIVYSNTSSTGYCNFKYAFENEPLQTQLPLYSIEYQKNLISYYGSSYFGSMFATGAGSAYFSGSQSSIYAGSMFATGAGDAFFNGAISGGLIEYFGTVRATGQGTAAFAGIQTIHESLYATGAGDGVFNGVRTTFGSMYATGAGDGYFSGTLSGAGGGGTTLTSGLVAWWDLNETGGTRFDSHGTYDLAEYNGAGTITYTGGSFDAAVFNGLYELRDASVTPDFDIVSGFTISMWVYPTGATLANLGFFSATSSSSCLMYSVDEDVDSRMMGNNLTPSTTTLTSGQWYHICATHDGPGNGNHKIFFNGVLKGRELSTSVSTTGTMTANLQIGAQSSRRFTGFIKRASIWTRGLSDGGVTDVNATGSGEVAELYNGGTPLSYGDL